MAERRTIERVHLIHYLRVFNRANGAFVGNLVDITPHGIQLVTEVEIPVNTFNTLRMEFPEEVMGKMQIEFDGTVIWCRLDENPTLFAAGLRLENILPGDLEIIRYLIDLYRD